MSLTSATPEKSFIITPSPAKDYFRVEIKTPIMPQVEIIKGDGRPSKILYDFGNSTFNTSDVPNGSYTIKIVDTSGKIYLDNLIIHH